MLVDNVGFVCTARALVFQIQDGDPTETLAAPENFATERVHVLEPDLDHPYARFSSAEVGGDVAAVKVEPSAGAVGVGSAVARARGTATAARDDPPKIKVVTEVDPNVALQDDVTLLPSSTAPPLTASPTSRSG